VHRVFAPQQYARVPDGTLVCPFLNPGDGTSGLTHELADGHLGMAAGRLEPGTASRVHVLPLVTQITWVIRGRLRVLMADLRDTVPYELEVGAGEAACTQPGELLQLVNGSARDAVDVLYVTSPGYLYQTDERDNVVYDDAHVVGASWDEIDEKILARCRGAGIASLRRARAEALERHARE